jgi:hypothetical protein
MVNPSHSKFSLFLRRIRFWLRSPLFYIHRANNRFFGVKQEFLNQSRENFPKGSFEWLVLSELHYGGFQIDATSKQLNSGSLNQGGDRMSELHHGYGRSYAEFLKPYLNKAQKPTLVEVGILNGSGLAIWCDLFPNSRIAGLDINLSNFQTNYSNLKSLDAFNANNPELFLFDQLDLENSPNILRKNFKLNEINIVIDDGCHTLESIELTFKMLQPYLSKEFVYFIEDNFDTFDYMSRLYPKYKWISRGELTICQNYSS